MKYRTDYKLCPHCGAALDVGEQCDCERENGPVLLWNYEGLYNSDQKRRRANRRQNERVTVCVH